MGFVDLPQSGRRSCRHNQGAHHGTGRHSVSASGGCRLQICFTLLFQLSKRVVCLVMKTLGHSAESLKSYLFDIFLGASYNQSPPSVKYMTVILFSCPCAC